MALVKCQRCARQRAPESLIVHRAADGHDLRLCEGCSSLWDEAVEACAARTRPKGDKSVRIEVTERFLETFGAGTLVGTLLLHVDDGLADIGEVMLAFPETPHWWREQHGGPDQIVVNEFVIRLLLEDVLRLQARGITVRPVAEDKASR